MARWAFWHRVSTDSFAMIRTPGGGVGEVDRSSLTSTLSDYSETVRRVSTGKRGLSAPEAPEREYPWFGVDLSVRARPAPTRAPPPHPRPFSPQGRGVNESWGVSRRMPPPAVVVDVPGGAAADLATVQQLRGHPFDRRPVGLLVQDVLGLGQQAAQEALGLAGAAGPLQGQVLGEVVVPGGGLPAVRTGVPRLGGDPGQCDKDLA